MRLIIIGEPVSQARMRHYIRYGKIGLFDPCAKEKKAVRAFVESKKTNFFQHPKLSFLFHMPIPKSLPIKIKTKYEWGFFRHEKKPDTDNLIKFYMDCLDGILFDGDQKVSLGPCVKCYHPVPKTIIFIEEKREELDQSDVDAWENLEEFNR
jgi:Holliday junction resolvase RusA-like endonuclease